MPTVPQAYSQVWRTLMDEEPKKDKPPKPEPKPVCNCGNQKCNGHIGIDI